VGAFDWARGIVSGMKTPVKRRTKAQIARAEREARRAVLKSLRAARAAVEAPTGEEERDAIEALPESLEERVWRETESKKKFNLQAQDRFLRYFAIGGTVAEAARAAGVSAVSVHREKREDAEFARRYQNALELNTDGVEDLLRNLAAGGNVTAIFGVLRARRPAVWREQKAVDMNATHNVAASAELFAQLVAALGKAGKAPTTSDPG